MALLPYLDEKDASPEIREAFSARPFVLNVQRMTANAQKIFMHRARLTAKQCSFLADHDQSEAQRNCDFADRQGLPFRL